MSPKTTFPGRLKAARQSAGYKTSKAFLEAHHIPYSTYSQYETGRRTPDDETIRSYSKLLNVNYEWLKNGEGSPFTNKNASTKQETIMNDGLLDLPTLQQNEFISFNEKLLIEILKQMLEATKNKQFSSEIIAEGIAGIYSDIISTNQSLDNQLNMVGAAISTFIRYAKK